KYALTSDAQDLAIVAVALSRYHLNRQRSALLAGGVVNHTRNEAVGDKRDLAPLRQRADVDPLHQAAQRIEGGFAIGPVLAQRRRQCSIPPCIPSDRGRVQLYDFSRSFPPIGVRALEALALGFQRDMRSRVVRLAVPLAMSSTSRSSRQVML